MSATKTSGGKAASKTSHPDVAPPPPPLKPRPKLFWMLLGLWVIWVGVLLTLYFKTVYPYRNVGTGAERTPEAQTGK